MILIDFSQLSITTLMGHLKGDKTTEVTMSMCRNLFLRAILEYKGKYEKRFGQIVIAVDGNDYWRRQIFPDYKCSRKKSKEDSGYDWEKISECINTMQMELSRFFPYTVVRTPEAEGDDIIGVLVEWSQENDLVTEGLFNSPEETIIISADGDLSSLTKYKSVKQFSPITRKAVTLAEPVELFCLNHVLYGDATDSISNIVSPQNFFRLKMNTDEPMRQGTVGAKAKKFYYDQILEHGKVIEYRSPEEEIRFKQNETMVLMSHIPENVKQGILDEFELQKSKQKNRKHVLQYLISAKLQNLIGEAENF